MRASDRAVHKQSKCSDPFWFCFFYFIWLDLYHLFPYENSIIFNPEKEVLTAIYFHFDFAEDSKVMISISQSSHVFYSTLNSKGRPKFWSSSSELLSHQLFLKILSPNIFFFFFLFTLCHHLSYSSLALFGKCEFPLHLFGDHIYNLFVALIFLKNVVSRTDSYSTFARPCMLFVSLPIQHSTLCSRLSGLGEVI